MLYETWYFVSMAGFLDANCVTKDKTCLSATWVYELLLLVQAFTGLK